MQNKFSPSPRVPVVLAVPTLLKSANSKSHLRLKANPWLWSPVKMKSKLHISNIQWNRVDIPIPKGRSQGHRKKQSERIKERPKSRTGIRYCSSKSIIWTTWRQDVLFKGLGQYHFFSLVSCGAHVIYLSLVVFLAIYSQKLSSPSCQSM